MGSHAPMFLLHCQKQHCLTSICSDHYFLPLQISHLYSPILDSTREVVPIYGIWTSRSELGIHLAWT